jgi:arylsulfatase
MSLSRRAFVRLMMSAAALSHPRVLSGAARVRQSGGSTAPSFLFFLSDDLGYGDLGCYGHPFNLTPRLDRLAKEGCRFTDAHAASSICSPSRAALLTGRQPYRLGIYYLVEADVHLRRSEITIASLLKQRGYDTCFVGKWHVTRIGDRNQGQPSPGDFGFDHWFATEHNAFEGPQNPTEFIRNGKAVGKVDGWYCDVIVREALEWLRHRPNPGRPFFIHACSHEPHTPLAPPESFAAMYDRPEVGRLEKHLPHGGVPRPDRDLSDEGRHYYGTVTQLDAAVERLLDGIEATGQDRNLLTFFTSDNGPEYPVNWMESRDEWEDPLRDRSFGTPGELRGMKRSTYEGGHRVPLIVRWPGHIRPGSISDALINGTDVLPTLCELAGARVPTDRVIDGASFAGALAGRPVARRIPAVWTFPIPYTFMPPLAMREDNYVLAAWFAPKDRAEKWIDYIKRAKPVDYELYDVRADPGQTVNLVSREPERLQRMAAELDTTWRGIQAEAPVWRDWDRR